MRFVFVAREAGTVRIAAGTADAMTSNAELLASAAVTAGARHRINPRVRAVIASSGSRDPTGGVRIAGIRCERGDAESRMTLHAKVFSVTATA